MTPTPITTIPRNTADSADIERPRDDEVARRFNSALVRATAQSAHVRIVIRAPQNDTEPNLPASQAERTSLISETGNQIAERVHERIAREGSLTPIAQLASQQLTEAAGRPPTAEQPSSNAPHTQPQAQPQPRAEQSTPNTARSDQPAVQTTATTQQAQTAPPTTETAPPPQSSQAASSPPSAEQQAAPTERKSSNSGRHHQHSQPKPGAAITATKGGAKPGTPQTLNSFSSSPHRAAQISRSRAATPAQKTPFVFDQARLEAQAARGLAAALKQRGGVVTMRLNPASLGTLKVRVQMRSGVIDARFEASNAQARELLESNLTSLRAALESRGLTVERLIIVESPTQEASERGFVGDDRGSEDPAEDRPNQHAGENGAGRATPGSHATEGQHAPDDPASDAPGERDQHEFVGGAGITIRLDTVV